MTPEKAYDEVVDFIAANNPRGVLAYRPSKETKDRVADLIFREKSEGLPHDEKSELDHTMMMEQLMRLAKARAYRVLIE